MIAIQFSKTEETNLRTRFAASAAPPGHLRPSKGAAFYSTASCCQEENFVSFKEPLALARDRGRGFVRSEISAFSAARNTLSSTFLLDRIAGSF
jgi:hypothetical protein